MSRGLAQKMFADPLIFFEKNSTNLLTSQKSVVEYWCMNNPTIVKRGRGRPKKADKAPERVTSKAYKHKGGRKTNEDSSYGQAQQIYNDLADIRAVAKQAQGGGQFPQGFASRLESALWAAMTLIKNQQSGAAQVREEELDEKAVSKSHRRAAGIAGQHADRHGDVRVPQLDRRLDHDDAAGRILRDPWLGARRHGFCRDRKSTRLNSSHMSESRMPSSA